MKSQTDQTVAHQAANLVVDVADGVRSAAHNVTESARSAGHSVMDKVGRAEQSVHDTYQAAGHRASECVSGARARLRAGEMGIERRIQRNPWTSRLIAAAVGGIVVAWCRRA
jgi:ElaB/YqjD/DUF883 family membrane-anchored ribosome-binding protein